MNSPDAFDHAVNHLDDEVVGVGPEHSEEGTDDRGDYGPDEDVVDVFCGMGESGRYVGIAAAETFERSRDESGVEERGDEIANEDQHQKGDEVAAFGDTSREACEAED